MSGGWCTSRVTTDRPPHSEIHGYGSYFALYEAMVAMNLRSDSNLTRATLPLTSAGFFGACSGVGMWLAMVGVSSVAIDVRSYLLRRTVSYRCDQIPNANRRAEKRYEWREKIQRFSRLRSTTVARTRRERILQGLDAYADSVSIASEREETRADSSRWHSAPLVNAITFVTFELTMRYIA